MRYLFDEVPEACDNTLWIAERADVDDRVRQAAAAQLPAARGLRRPTPSTCSTSRFEGARRAVGRASCPTPSSSASPTSSRSSRTWGSRSYFLIVWDLISTPATTASGSARAGAARPAARWPTRSAHHRPRPDQVRPAVRALPQPEPHLDARHRHGLRLPLPGRDDPLRGRELRARPRRPDRHLLHHQGPGRGARRRPGARLPVRRRRQGGQGHAAADHGPRHAAVRLPRAAPEVRGRLQDGRRAPEDVRGRPRRRQGRSRWPRASRACAARTASTPPRW